MSSIFHAALYQPILNLLIWLYNVIPGHDLGIVILILTVLVRLVLFPLTAASIKAQRSMQELQPKMDAIKKEFPTDKQKQAEATMALYKTHKINPLTSCLPMLVQLPILIALFYVLSDAIAAKNLATDLYGFVGNPGTLKTITLGFLNLANPNIIMAILAGGAQYLQARGMVTRQPPKAAGEGGKDEGMTAMMNKQMLYFMPALTVLIGLKFPAGLTLYWFLSTALMVVQQMWMQRGKPTISSTPVGVIEGTIVK